MLLVVFREAVLYRIESFLPVTRGRPNVILITLDTTRADRLGCYGYTQARTPTLDRLAREGTLFENARCQIPITQPSHVSIMTGTNPTYHATLANLETMPDEGVTTLAEAFSAAGYRTGAAIGAFVVASKFGLGRGFQEFYEDFPIVPMGASFIREKPSQEVIEIARRWIHKNGNERFFLWIHLFDPHIPYLPPAPFDRAYRDRPYDGEIAYMDYWIGQLLDDLAETRLDRRTVVVAVGDHGESLGEHEEDTHAYFLYNSTLSIPLIFWAPGRVPSSVRIPDVVRSVDVAPTILDLAGLAIPGNMQGTSLVGAWDDDSPRVPFPLPSLSITEEFNRSFGWATLRALELDGYKYIRLPTPELYDLASDPKELVNLSTSQPQRVAEMDALLTEIIEETRRDAPRPAATPIDRETLESLMSLGYISGGSRNEPVPFDAAVEDMIDPKDRLGFWTDFRRLTELRSAGDLDQVEALARSMLDQDENALIVAYLLGQALWHKSELDPDPELLREAAQYLTKASEIEECRLSCLVFIGIIHAKLEELDLARSVFEQVLSIDPEEPMAHYNLTLLHSLEENWDGVIQNGEKLLKLIPNHPNAPAIEKAVASARRKLGSARR